MQVRPVCNVPQWNLQLRQQFSGLHRLNDLQQPPLYDMPTPMQLLCRFGLLLVLIELLPNNHH